MSVFDIYSSSAGSGKTYTLAKNYLEICLEADTAFKQILAVTFTNKATEEMKTRIIHRLYDLACGKKIEYTDYFLQHFNISEATLQRKAQQSLQAMLYHYSWVSISTIDSFFQDILRAFEREVGLGGGFKIEMDNDKVLNALIEEAIQTTGQDEQLTRYITSYVKRRVNDGKSWDFRTDFKKLGNEMFKEEFFYFSKAMNELLQNAHFLQQFFDIMQSFVKDFEDTIRQEAQKALDIIQQYNLTEKDFMQGVRGVYGYFERLSKEKISKKDSFLPNRYVKETYEHDNWYPSKVKDKVTLQIAINGGLSTCLENIITQLKSNYKQYLSALAVKDLEADLGLLSYMAQFLEKYRQDNKTMLISDTAPLIKSILETNNTPFIYEKVGSKYRNFLIDEFQDTSNLQYHNFKPLLEEALSVGAFSMVVGDVKQSIYRWRGGDLDLLLEELEQDFPEAQRNSLQDNYRSCENVIAVNNAIFDAAPKLLANYLTDLLEKNQEEEYSRMPQEKLQSVRHEIEKIKIAYSDGLQYLPKHKKEATNKGYVEIRFIQENTAGKATEEEIATQGVPYEPSEDGDEARAGWKDTVLAKLPLLLETLQDQGIACKDIMFLVRKSYDGALIVKTMNEYRNSAAAKEGYSYDVVSSESLFLYQSPAVRFLIAVLQYLMRTNDQLAIATLLHEYLFYLKPNAEQQQVDEVLGNELNEDLLRKYLPERFFAEKKYLNRLSLFETVENLIDMFGLQHIPEAVIFIQALQDEIINYEKQYYSDIAGFLNWWQESGKQKSVQMPQLDGAARILTIHKSKGLESKVVIIPFADWELDHSALKAPTLWAKVENDMFQGLNILPVRYNKGLSDTYFAYDYWQEKVKIHLDNLNLLYVALTRAEEQLYVFAPYKEKKETKKESSFNPTHIGDVLQYLMSQERLNIAEKQTSAAEKGHILPFAHLFEHFDIASTTFRLGKIIQKDKEIIAEKAYSPYQIYRWKNRITVKKISQDFFERTTQQREYINYGKVIHNLMAEVRYESDIPKAIEKAMQRGEITHQQRYALLQKLNTLLENPQIKDWFSTNWQVRNEITILSSDGSQLRPDRIITKEKQAIVIDFKAALPSPDHVAQVRQYKAKIKEMGYEPVTGYLLYLNSATMEEV